MKPTNEFDDFLAQHSTDKLLKLHSEIGNMLRSRGVVRSSNNPVGDLSEYLFCNAFDWSQEANSKASIDATDKQGLTYQIKGRRLTAHNRSRQLSALRNLSEKSFDFLAGVLFNEDYSIYRAILIPIDIVLNNSRYSKHVNAHLFVLRDEIWEVKGVTDITDLIALELRNLP